MSKIGGFFAIPLLLIISIVTLAFRNTQSDGSIYWEGNGRESLPCESGAHWIFSPGDGYTSVILYILGVPYPMEQNGGPASSWEVDTGSYLGENLQNNDVWVVYSGEGSGFIKLSHCIECPTPTPTFTETPDNTPTSTSTYTPTSTNTYTPTPSDTYTPTPTFTNTPTSTKTHTPTPSNTPTTTYTPSPTPTGTLTPTDTYTPTPTQTATYTPTETSTPTVTPTKTYTPTVTVTPEPTSTETPTAFPTATNTPRPPEPAEADSNVSYPGEPIGTLYANKTSYSIYEGVNAADGSLLLPGSEKGGALYQNQLWIHRAWNSGWFKLAKGDLIGIVYTNGSIYYYEVTGSTIESYGKYFSDGKFHIITCYGAESGVWSGVEVYNLKLIKIINIK